MTSVEHVELELLREAVRRVHGVDLAAYARPLLLEALRALCAREGLANLSAVQGWLLRRREALAELAEALAFRPRQPFSDPEFLLALRSHVLPVLRTHPSVRVWHVECGTGEDTHALAVVLEEEGLLGRTRLYATDFSEAALEQARRGRLRAPLAEAAARHRRAGGTGVLFDYGTVDHDELVLDPRLFANTFFGHHHLPTDGELNEFQLVLCRDVLLRFSPATHARVHATLFRSLARFGYLALGRRESVAPSAHHGAYEALEQPAGVFRRAA